jgi:hypothetical protein
MARPAIYAHCCFASSDGASRLEEQGGAGGAGGTHGERRMGSWWTRRPEPAGGVWKQPWKLLKRLRGAVALFLCALAGAKGAKGAKEQAARMAESKAPRLMQQSGAAGTHGRVRARVRSSKLGNAPREACKVRAKERHLPSACMPTVVQPPRTERILQPPALQVHVHTICHWSSYAHGVRCM